VWQSGDSFHAEVFVPVWTSQLFVSDWWEPSAAPLNVRVSPRGEEGWKVTVENTTDSKLSQMRLVLEGTIRELDGLGAKETKTFNVAKGEGMNLRQYVSQHGQNFQGAVQARQSTFGASGGGHIDDLANASVAASFLSLLGRTENSSSFVAPPGLDLVPVVEHGRAVLLAWAADYTPVKSMCRFTPRRNHHDTLWRVAVDVK
jgi:hypothetical protein